MTETFKIMYPTSATGKKAWNREYGLNSLYSGKHWSKRKRDADFWHLMTRDAMDYAQCRRKPFAKPVVITFLWNDRLDCSNHAYMAKMIEDAMTGRLIINDTRAHVKGIEHYFHDKDYIKVIVKEIEK